MKTFICCLITSLFTALHPYETISQDNSKGDDQLKLMQAWLGTWLYKPNKDTVEVWKLKAYGSSFTMDVVLEIKGKKRHVRKNNFTYSQEAAKFKGFQIYPDRNYDTWTGSFVSDKKFNLEITKDFIPGSTNEKYEMVMDTPSSFIVTRFENGVKIKEYKYKKEK